MKWQVVLVLSLLLAILPASATAGAESFQFSGEDAYAFFSSTDPNNNCILTEVILLAIEGRRKIAAGKPETISRFLIDLSRSNTCTYQSLVFATGTANLSPDAFQVNKELTTASLQATVQACDFLADDNCVSLIPVAINLTWSGTGEIQRNKNVSHSNNEGCHFNFRTMGDTRVAVATGSITALGLNFTPAPSSIADLSSGKDAGATINCP